VVVLGRPVRRHEIAEFSAAGAGIMAGVACGFWTEEQSVAILSPHGRKFEFAVSDTARDDIVKRWLFAAWHVSCWSGLPPE
jgi:glycerol kinase